MASLKCSNCGNGIHYHGIPDGTMLVLFEMNFWEWLVKQEFDKNNKTFDKDGYPFLYRADTVQTEFSDNTYKFWRCKECGTLALFKPTETAVDSIFVPDEQYRPNQNARLLDRYICFEDYLWDDITEKKIPVSKIMDNIEEKVYVFVYEDGLIWYNDVEGSNPVKYFRKGEIAVV